MTQDDLRRALNALGRIPVERVEEIMQAKRDGRCVVLPCKVGDTVYRVEGDEVYDEWQIGFVVVYPDEIVAFDDSGNEIRADDIGKTVFLTRAEAEAALKGAEHERD